MRSHVKYKLDADDDGDDDFYLGGGSDGIPEVVRRRAPAFISRRVFPQVCSAEKFASYDPESGQVPSKGTHVQSPVLVTVGNQMYARSLDV